MEEARKNVEKILEALGGPGNILQVTNCMTRLRVVVASEEKVREKELKKLGAVLGLVHDRAGAFEVVVGPGNSAKYAGICYDLGLPKAAAAAGGDWRANREQIKGRQKSSGVKSFLKVFGDIFVPLIPGIIAAGLCAGFASLIAQLVPGYQENIFWGVVHGLLTLINTSFMTYITAWAGYRAAERFGATPILGGMLGLITSLDGINGIATLLGLYNEADPLASVLRAGKGGVLAVIAGVFLLSLVEKGLRRRMPASVDFVLTPLLTLLLCVIPYVLLIMPVFGLLSTGISTAIGYVCMSQSLLVRLLVGFAATALFLPLVAMGMHHGLVALYTVQLSTFGRVTLYPALAMAGAGQVGAALAIRKKARRAGNTGLVKIIDGAVPAGFMGVGEPLIYGVTLPLGKPFITAGLGAGFGGAVAMALQVASTTWGPSGLVGVFVMTAGEGGPIRSILGYLAGLFVSYVMGYIVTAVTLKEKDVLPEEEESDSAEAGDASAEEESAVSKKPAAEAAAVLRGRRVSHGDLLFGGAVFTEKGFSFPIGDPLGIHARPAGELAELMKQYRCEVTLRAGDRAVSQKSALAYLSLGAVQGTILYVSAEGEDAEKALEAAAEYLENHMRGEKT